MLRTSGVGICMGMLGLAALACSSQGSSADDLPVAAASRALTYEQVVLGMAPVGWWRLNEASGATQAADSSGKGHHGSYVNSPTLGGAGVVTGDASAAFASASQQYVQIADHDDFSLTKVTDSFARTVALGSSWGTPAGSAFAWSPAFNTGNDYWCDGTTALIQETTTGSWGQTLNVARQDVDVRALGSWSVAAAGGVMAPLAVMARYADASNYYRAELRENTDHTLDLQIGRVVAGSYTPLASAVNVGTYSVGARWYVRLQVETDHCSQGGTTLRAKAWADAGSTTVEPTNFQATASDSSLSAAGAVGIRSSNLGTTSNPLVSLHEFRVQSVGLSVAVWMRPSTLTFAGGEGTSPDNYVHWLGKGEKISGNSQMEWGLRFYNNTQGSTRPNRISAYAWNLAGGEGAGSYSQTSLSTGSWVHFTAVFDPGDKQDQSAGVFVYKNGAAPSQGSLRFYKDYSVVPANGTAPLRVATRSAQNSTTPSYFDGAIDELAIFDRKLCASEVTSLYNH
ncbi:MAG: hypothetical protein QM756_20080 [Polyangiaceae bacterium]